MFPVILSQLLGYMSTLFLEFTAPPELQWFWAASTCVPSKAPAFPLKSDFAFRSDSCNSRHWYFREWFGYLPWEILVQLLTRKVKHYFHSFSKLTCRTKDQAVKQRILGNGWAKNLYQESSNFIPIPELKKNITRLFFTTEGILASSCSSSSSFFQVHFGFYH